MHRRQHVLRFALLTILVGHVGIGGALADTLAASPVYIIACRCSTAPARSRIADAVRHEGGRVVYMYDTMPNLAVTPARAMKAADFVRRLRRIRGVLDVRISGEVGLHASP